MSAGKPPRKLTSEEQRLWQKVVDQVEVIKASPAQKFDLPISLSGRPFTLPKAPIKSFRVGQKAKGARLEQFQTPAVTKHPAAVSPNMDKREYQRLIKGKLGIDGTLDLHGLTADQARLQLIPFVQSAHRSGSRLLLVITGKGKKAGYDEFNRPKIGVLKQGVPEWLQSGVLSQLVLQVTQAHEKHGGGGAYYVYLRRKR